MKKQPIQPLQKDESGTIRFQSNQVVKYLLDNGGIDMNDLARQDFRPEDEEQFAQLIGYSLGGFGDLSYVSGETYDAAEIMSKTDETPDQARIKALETTLKDIRSGLKEASVSAFRIHPDDLR